MQLFVAAVNPADGSSSSCLVSRSKSFFMMSFGHSSFVRSRCYRRRWNLQQLLFRSFWLLCFSSSLSAKAIPSSAAVMEFFELYSPHPRIFEVRFLDPDTKPRRRIQEGTSYCFELMLLVCMNFTILRLVKRKPGSMSYLVYLFIFRLQLMMTSCHSLWFYGSRVMTTSTYRYRYGWMSTAVLFVLPGDQPILKKILVNDADHSALATRKMKLLIHFSSIYLMYLSNLVRYLIVLTCRTELAFVFRGSLANRGFCYLLSTKVIHCLSRTGILLGDSRNTRLRARSTENVPVDINVCKNYINTGSSGFSTSIQKHSRAEFMTKIIWITGIAKLFRLFRLTLKKRKI